MRVCFQYLHADIHEEKVRWDLGVQEVSQGHSWRRMDAKVKERKKD